MPPHAYLSPFPPPPPTHMRTALGGPGTIDYNEFVAATMHMSKLEKEEVLQSVSGRGVQEGERGMGQVGAAPFPTLQLPPSCGCTRR